jgi:hypothetical protein
MSARFALAPHPPALAEPGDLVLTELGRVAPLVEQDEPPNPVHVGIDRLRAVVANTERVGDLIQQAAWGRLPGLSGGEVTACPEQGACRAAA